MCLVIFGTLHINYLMKSLNTHLMIKKRLSDIFKDKENEQLKEQLDLFNRVLNSKEEDIKAKELQHSLMCEFWREKEKHFEFIMQQKEHEVEVRRYRYLCRNSLPNLVT